jgi:hypothetical protein
MGSMIIYLVGHSGVGKSNAISELRSSHPEVAVTDLDAECADHEFDWGVVGLLLSQLHATTDDATDLVVNVGAGTQTIPEFPRFLQESSAAVVLVTAPPDEVILRQPVPGRHLHEFIDTEYTKRQELFSLAVLRVDVAGLTKEESARRVVDGLQETFADNQ